jgi:hypothetical protein
VFAQDFLFFFQRWILDSHRMLFATALHIDLDRNHLAKHGGKCGRVVHPQPFQKTLRATFTFFASDDDRTIHHTTPFLDGAEGFRSIQQMFLQFLRKLIRRASLTAATGVRPSSSISVYLDFRLGLAFLSAFIHLVPIYITYFR